MMKNYKSIRNFYEAMQQKPHQNEQRNVRQRIRSSQDKQEPELSFKKVIDFFKGIKP
jgi:hypothetical protein